MSVAGLIFQRTEQAGSIPGGSISETSDRVEALKGTHVVYAGSWSFTLPNGNKVKDQAPGNQHSDWCIDESWFDMKTSDPCYVMHGLPVRRDVEGEDHILDSMRSISVQQARNPMYALVSVRSSMLS